MGSTGNEHRPLGDRRGLGCGVRRVGEHDVTPPLGTRTRLLGPVAWLSGYVVLPLAKVYQPIWKYDTKTLAQDLAVHIVYGAAASTAFAVLAR